MKLPCSRLASNMHCIMRLCCILDSSTGLEDPSYVNVASYVLAVVVYLDNDPAVVKEYVVGSGTFGSSQSYAIPKFIVEDPSGLVNNVIC